MIHETNDDAGSGVAVSLRIPAGDPDLFKHKATDDVLLFLSRHRFDEFTVAEVAARTGHTNPTVGRALDVLVGNGLVEEQAEGTRRLVSIARDRLSVPDDPFLRIPQQEFQPPARAAVDELTSRLDDLIGVVLYGSVARGEADRRSDVDLWVLVAEDRAAHRRTVNEIELDLAERTFENGRYDFDIDVEAVSSVPRYTGDVREIVLSGIPLFETTEFETVERLLVNEADADE